MKNIKQLITKSSTLFLIIALMLSLCACQELLDVFSEDSWDIDDSLSVTFINVGQGDAILLKDGDAAILVDAGPNSAEDEVLHLLEERHVEHLDLVVATHPHEDHIGGMAEVIRTIPIDEFLMPDAVSTTRTFEDMVDALTDEDVKTTAAKAGEVFTFHAMTLTVLSPDEGETYDNLNNYSVVIRVDIATGSSLLLTGDAEAPIEENLLKSGYDLNADVLKIAHHGSNTATTQAFLEAVDPEFAVIMVDEDHNSYGHPHAETMEKLNAYKSDHNMNILRTDLNGTITMTFDEQGITVYKEQ